MSSPRSTVSEVNFGPYLYQLKWCEEHKELITGHGLNDPVLEAGDPGVDAGVVLQSASHAHRYDPRQNWMSSAVFADQRTAGVALW